MKAYKNISDKRDIIDANSLIGCENLEPGIIYARKKEVWSVNVPIAVRRNRLESVPEHRDNVRDAAAFADYLILVGYLRRF